MNIRKLTPNDWNIYQQIRLEALQLHPEAFGSAYKEEATRTEQEWRKELTDSHVFGAFDDNTIVGIAGYFIYTPIKQRHRGNLFTVYLKKEFRGQGIANQLLQTVIADARKHIIQLHCSVVTTLIPAIKLYQKYGFVIFGTQPRTLKVNGVYYDLHLMLLKFSQ